MAEKNIYISYLRVIATVFVILIHASTGFLNKFAPHSLDWNYANWINSFTRCSVPIFVMLSGALLIPKQEDVFPFCRKRLPTLLYPFIFWTIIYLIYYFYRYTNFESLSILRILEVSGDKILHGANAHLWYLYMIFGIYVAIPYLSKLLKHLQQKEILLILFLWLVSMFVMNRGFYSYVPRFDLTFFSGYIGYIILGYYMITYPIRASKYILLVGFISLGIITAFGTYYLSSINKKYDPTLYNYLMPTTAFAAFFLFGYIQKLFANQTSMPKWIAILDKYSFGIYLAHIIPLNYVHPMISKYVSTGWVIPSATFSTLILSILITYLLRKIPLGKYVSG